MISKSKQTQVLKSSQKIVDEKQFVDIQNQYGGFVYAGGTMAFTALYWALGYYSPHSIDILGCDMVYPKRFNPFLWHWYRRSFKGRYFTSLT